MTKKEIEAKIKEIINKYPQYKDIVLKVNFTDKKKQKQNLLEKN